MKVLWTRRAADQFEAKADSIAVDHPRAAAEWVARINDSVDDLARFPLRGQRLGELTSEPVRVLTIGLYRVIYRVDEGRVTVLSIKHSREAVAADDLRPDYP